jgi:(2Fe-2S) ferredoxin
VTQKIMTKAEREAAEARARAARVLAVAAARADAEMRAELLAADGDAPASSDPPRFVARIEVCTNNACAKRGGKEVLSALLLLAEENETRARVECRRSRCMDACASACVVRVNGAGGMQRHAHVGADEAGEIFELATGVVVE